MNSKRKAFLHSLLSCHPKMMQIISACVVFSMFALNTVADNYRWTGGGSDNKWSTLANWEVQSDINWVPASNVPGSDDSVRFGDACADEPQTIELDGNVLVQQLVMDATGNRDYTMVSPQDGNGEELYTFSMSLNLYPLDQTAATTCSLTFKVKIDFTYLAINSTFPRFGSASHASVILERTLARETGKDLFVLGTTNAKDFFTGGKLVFKTPVKYQRIYLYSGCVLVLDCDTEGFAFTGTIAHYSHGSLWITRDTRISGNMYSWSKEPFNIRPDPDVEGEVSLYYSGSANRLGYYYIGSDNEQNNSITVSVGGIDTGGNESAPFFNLASNATLELRGNQTLPFFINPPSAILGAGKLVTSDSAVTRTIGMLNSNTGGTYIRGGALKLIAGNSRLNKDTEETGYTEGQIGSGLLSLGADTTFDLNGINQTVSSLEGVGTVQLAGATLSATNGIAPGIDGVGTLAVAGNGKLEISGNSSRLEFTSDVNVFDKVVFSGAADLELSGALEIVAPEDFMEYGAGQYVIFEMDGGSVTAAVSPVIAPENMWAEVYESDGNVILHLHKMPVGSILLVR